MQQHAKSFSRVWHDRPMSPMETAVYWTEYVARYNGAPNLLATSVNKAWYQQLQLDVLSFIALVVYVMCYVVGKIVGALCCCCYSNDAEYVSVQAEERRTKRVKFE